MEKFREVIPHSQNELLKEIEEAKKNALSVDELELIKDQQDELVRKFLQGEIDGKEHDKQMEELDVQLGLIKRRGLTEFAELLNIIGLSKDVAEEILAHENEHNVKALQYGLDPEYQIQFLRKPNGQFSIYPGVRFNYPEDMPDEERRRIDREITEAPEELSPRDRKQLEE